MTASAALYGEDKDESHLPFLPLSLPSSTLRDLTEIYMDLITLIASPRLSATWSAPLESKRRTSTKLNFVLATRLGSCQSIIALSSRIRSLL